jgi:hypothetical protein
MEIEHKQNIFYSGGATLSVLLGQAINSNALGTYFVRTGVPGCTGVCGACSGSCVGTLAVVGWLGYSCWRQRNEQVGAVRK